MRLTSASANGFCTRPTIVVSGTQRMRLQMSSFGPAGAPAVVGDGAGAAGGGCAFPAGGGRCAYAAVVNVTTPRTRRTLVIDFIVLLLSLLSPSPPRRRTPLLAGLPAS